MAFPDDLPTVTLTYEYDETETGNPLRGKVTFEAQYAVQQVDGDRLLLPGARVVAIRDGLLAVELPVTNSPDYSPEFYYVVTQELDGVENPEPYNLQVDVSLAGQTVSLGSLTPAQVGEVIGLYMPRTGGDFTGDISAPTVEGDTVQGGVVVADTSVTIGGDAVITRISAGVTGVDILQVATRLGIGKTPVTRLDVLGTQQNAVVAQIVYNGPTGNVVEELSIQGVEATGNGIALKVVGETIARFAMRLSGALRWGPGGASPLDTTLDRTGVAALQLTGSLNATAGSFDNGTLFRAPLFVRKTVDQQVTSSTTTVIDTELVMPTVLGATYMVDAMLIYDADPAGDLKITFTGATNATLSWSVVADGLTTNAAYTIASTVNLPVTTLGTKQVAHIRGVHVCPTNNGTLRLRWAQQTSNANPTTVYADSYLRLSRYA